MHEQVKTWYVQWTYKSWRWYGGAYLAERTKTTWISEVLSARNARTGVGAMDSDSRDATTAVAENAHARVVNVRDVLPEMGGHAGQVENGELGPVGEGRTK